MFINLSFNIYSGHNLRLISLKTVRYKYVKLRCYFNVLRCRSKMPLKNNLFFQNGSVKVEGFESKISKYLAQFKLRLWVGQIFHLDWKSNKFKTEEFRYKTLRDFVRNSLVSFGLLKWPCLGNTKNCSRLWNLNA